VNDQAFPVQDSTLSGPALAGWLDSTFDLPGPVTCRFHRKGICDTYRADTIDRRYYLKVYRHGRRSQLDVSEEVRLLRHLSSCGVSVARPIARRDGEFAGRLSAPEGDRFAVLYEAAPGTSGDNGDVGRIRAFGEAVGRLHVCADRIKPAYRRAHLDMKHLVHENLAVIEPFMSHRSADVALIHRVANDCEQRVCEILPLSKPEYGICHGDLHGGDVGYDNADQPVLFDFDSSGYGWRALDIGVFLASDAWMDTSTEAEEQRQEKLDVFLAGYESQRVLSDAEREAIQLTPAIRHIFLMGHVLRYTTLTQGSHWADDRFIDWHMAWFNHWATQRL